MKIIDNEITKILFPEFMEIATALSITFDQFFETSVRQLSRILGNPIAGINYSRRWGILFDEKEREAIKDSMETDDIISIQRIILDKFKDILIT